MSEQALQQIVIQWARALGILPYHTRDSRGSAKGFPDLVLVGSRILYRELKTQVGKLTAEQQNWGDRLLRGGGNWDVWRPEHMESGRILRELREIM